MDSTAIGQIIDLDRYPVIGERKRIVALFCYDRKPGTSFDQWYINQLSQGLPS